MNKIFETILERLSNISRVVKTYEDVEWNRAIYKSAEIVHQVAEEYNNGWIPCSEQLPKKDGFYLATLGGEIAGEEKPFSGLEEFENGKWVDDEEDYQCVLAWKPLPEPFKERD